VPVEASFVRLILPSVEQVDELPAWLTMRAPPEWQDHNGHVNVQHYLTLYDRASWPWLESLGLDAEWFKSRQRGLFDLEHHVWYCAEVHVGDEVSVHMRFVARTPKRFHGVMFVVNRTRRQVASAFEYLSTGADLERRTTAPLVPPLVAALDRAIAEHGALAWPAPTCGAIAP
jgi:acyl-CoA thioester hydrolase